MHWSPRNQKIKKTQILIKFESFCGLSNCPPFRLHYVKLYQNTVTPSLKLDDNSIFDIRFLETVILTGIFVPVWSQQREKGSQIFPDKGAFHIRRRVCASSFDRITIVEVPATYTFHLHYFSAVSPFSLWMCWNEPKHSRVRESWVQPLSRGTSTQRIFEVGHPSLLSVALQPRHR